MESGVLPRKSIGVQRVILDDEAGSGMHSHLGKTGFIWLWWIQGAIFVT
jgi:hypothetical protein